MDGSLFKETCRLPTNQIADRSAVIAGPTAAREEIDDHPSRGRGPDEHSNVSQDSLRSSVWDKGEETKMSGAIGVPLISSSLPRDHTMHQQTHAPQRATEARPRQRRVSLSPLVWTLDHARAGLRSWDWVGENLPSSRAPWTPRSWAQRRRRLPRAATARTARP